MKQLSKHNIISRIKDQDNYFLVNVLSGQAAILEPEIAEAMLNNTIPEDPEFEEKGFVINPQQEEKDFKLKYLEFIDQREQDEIQIFFVPTYACNFNCSYCYQSGYENAQQAFSKEIIDAFFEHINKQFAGRRKYITLFGGEPLLPGQKHKDLISYFLSTAIENKLQTAIVTNGYHLEQYLDMLNPAHIREVQVTLDGLADMHNHRRMLHSGAGTFEKISQGIDAALKKELTINLRMVIDKENIAQLPGLASYAIEKKWTAYPLFKTQLGRNYELHYCQDAQNKLFTRLEMYQEIYALLQKHPEIMDFHKPAFSVARFLFENGELPTPLFDACPACKTEWAFDYTGSIYSCTATVGKEDEKLGRFYPESFLDEEKINLWQDRDVLSIGQCRNCSMQLACGGGCGSVAKNNHGGIQKADCRPIKELLELGIAHYFGKEQ